MNLNDKQIINHLKTMTNVKPDSDWKTKNRELLYNQISSTRNTNKTGAFGFKYFFNNNIVFQYLQTIPQPSLVAVFIFVFLVSGSAISLRASENSIPGDSFYIAKIVGEKTQLALTFDEKDKARLGLEFAGKRAKEINQVLADTESSVSNDEKVEKLVVNFKKEIKVAKSRLEKINQNKIVENNKIVDNNKTAIVDSGVEKPAEEKLAEEAETEIFSANTGKDDVGINIYDPNENSGTDVATTPIVNEVPKTEVVSSSTKAVVAADPQELLKKAGESLNSDDIDATLSLIEEAGSVIDKVGDVEVESEVEVEVEEGASSTEKVK